MHQIQLYHRYHSFIILAIHWSFFPLWGLSLAWYPRVYHHRHLQWSWLLHSSIKHKVHYWFLHNVIHHMSLKSHFLILELVPYPRIEHIQRNHRVVVTWHAASHNCDVGIWSTSQWYVGLLLLKQFILEHSWAMQVHKSQETSLQAFHR